MGCRNGKSKLITKSGHKSSTIATSIKGSIGEYKVIIDYLSKGYYSKVINRCPTDAQKKLNIKLVMIDYER